MTGPTTERVAAALRLAEAVLLQLRLHPDTPVMPVLKQGADAYRATLPKLRTRAELDEERLLLASELYNGVYTLQQFADRWAELAPEPAPDICCPYTSGHERDCPRWPKAPGHEPVPFLTCADCGLTRDQEPTVAVRWDGRPRCNSCGSKSESNEERHARMNAAGLAKQWEILGRNWKGEDGKKTSHLTDRDADAREPEACGCEQAEALKDRNTELSRLLGHVHGTVAGLVELLGRLP